MKASKIVGLTVAVALVVGGVAFGAPVVETLHKFFKGGVTVANTAATMVSANKLMKVLRVPNTTVDFATGTTTCTESSAITVTGAATGDICIAAHPATGGSANASYTCYVDAADSVKLRHCPAGTADDPASATFGGVVLSFQ